MNILKRLSYAAVALVIGVVVASSIPSQTVLSTLTQATIYAVFALGPGLLLRQSGMVSFGHALFFGSSGYAVGILLRSHSMPAEAAIFVAILGTAVAAFFVGLVIVRVSGIAFGMLTLALGQMVFLTVYRSRNMTGGADGISIEFPASIFGVTTAALMKPAAMFVLCWSVLVILVLVLSWLFGSRFGSITEAIRDNEERARFVGIRTLLPRALVFSISAGATSVAGVLATLNTGFISPDSLHWSQSGVALMMVVVGGTYRLWGPALGAAVYIFAKELLGDHAQHWMAIFGFALILVVVFAPRGLSGLVCRIWQKKQISGGDRAVQPSRAASGLAAVLRRRFK